MTPCMWMEYFMNSGKDVEHEAFLVFWLFRGGFFVLGLLVLGHLVHVPYFQDIALKICFTRKNRMRFH